MGISVISVVFHFESKINRSLRHPTHVPNEQKTRCEIDVIVQRISVIEEKEAHC